MICAALMVSREEVGDRNGERIVVGEDLIQRSEQSRTKSEFEAARSPAVISKTTFGSI